MVVTVEARAIGYKCRMVAEMTTVVEKVTITVRRRPYSGGGDRKWMAISQEKLKGDFFRMAIASDTFPHVIKFYFTPYFGLMVFHRKPLSCHLQLHCFILVAR